MLTDSTPGHLAGPTDSDPAGLVLERLPSGELAWLRPADDLAAAIHDADELDQALARLVTRCDDMVDPRYRLTALGRDYLARLRAWAHLGIAPAEVSA